MRDGIAGREGEGEGGVHNAYFTQSLLLLSCQTDGLCKGCSDHSRGADQNSCYVKLKAIDKEFVC